MRWVFVGLIVLFVLSTFFFVTRSSFFTIKSADVQTDKVYCTDSNTLKNSIQLLGQNFFLLNSSKIREIIKNNFLCVRDIEILRHFPSRVTIFVSGREPKAQLLVLRNGEATEAASLEKIATPSAEEIEGLEVDEEGVIFAKSTNRTDIPKIYYGADLSLGQRVPSVILDSLEILEKIKSYGLEVKESQILDGLFLIYPYFGVPRIVLKLGENLDTQLASLQLILNQAKIDEKDLEFIDLRFDKPVVKLAPQKSKNGKR